MDNSVGYGAIGHNDIDRQRKQVIGNSGGEVCTDQVTISAISASAGDNRDDSSPSIQQCHASGTLQQLHNEHNINNNTIIGRENGAAVDVLHSSAQSGKSSAGNNNRRGKRKLETSGDSNAGQSGKYHCRSSSPPSPLSFTSETNNRTIASTNYSDHNNHENTALWEIENSIKLLKGAQERLRSESYMNPSMDKSSTWMNELDGIIDKLECLVTKVPRQCQVTNRSSMGQQENDEDCELSTVISPVPPPFPALDSSTPSESHPPSSQATHWLESEYMGESEEYNKIKKIVEDASRSCPFITGEISVGDTHVEDRNAAKVCALHSYPVDQSGAMALAAGGHRLLNGCMDVHVQDIIALMKSSYDNSLTFDECLDTILKSVVYLEAIPIVADSDIRSHADKKPYWYNLVVAKSVRMLSAIMTGKVLLKWKNLKLICGFGEEAQLTLQLIWALFPALRCKIHLPHLLKKVPHGQRVLYMWADIEARSLHLHQCDRIAAMLAGSEEPNGVGDVLAYGQVPGYRMRRNDDGTLTAEKQEADGTVYQVISHHDQKVLGTARSVQQLSKWFDCSEAIIRIILHNGKCIKSDDTIIFQIKEVSSDSVECGISSENMKTFTQLYKKHQLQPRIQLRMAKQETSKEDIEYLTELCDEFQNTTAGSQIDRSSLGLSARKKVFFCIKTTSGHMVHVSSTKLNALQKLGISSHYVQDDVVVARGMDTCRIESINAEEARRLGIDQTVKGAEGELKSIRDMIHGLLAIKGRSHLVCIKTTSGHMVYVSSSKANALQKLGISSHSHYVQDDVVVVHGKKVCRIESIDVEEAYGLGIDDIVEGAEGELESIRDMIQGLLAIKGGTCHLVCIKTTSGEVVHVSSTKANALHKLGITENCVKHDVVVVGGMYTCRIESIDVEEAHRLGIDQTVKGAEGELESICERIQDLDCSEFFRIILTEHTSKTLAVLNDSVAEKKKITFEMMKPMRDSTLASMMASMKLKNKRRIRHRKYSGSQMSRVMCKAEEDAQKLWAKQYNN